MTVDADRDESEREGICETVQDEGSLYLLGADEQTQWVKADPQTDVVDLGEMQ